MNQRQGHQTGESPDLETLAEVSQLLLQQAADGILITNQQGNLIEANLSGCQMLGYDHEELMQLSWQDLLAAETSGPDALAPDNAAVGQTASGASHLRRQDGQLILVNISAHTLNNGNILRIVHELSASQRQEETWRERIEQDEQLSKIIAAAPGVIYTFQFWPDGTVTFPYASPPIQDIFGLTPEELAKDASPVLAVIHPDDVTAVQESIADSARTMLPWQTEYRVQHPVKGKIWVQAHSKPELQPDGSVLWYGYLQDITERKEADRALLASEAQLTLVTDALPALVSYVDTEERYQFINHAYETWYGYSKAQLKGQHLEQVLGTAVYQAISPYVKRALAGETLTYETILPYADQARHVQAIYIPDIGSQGQVNGYFALVNDISSRKQAEGELKTNQARLTGIIESAMDAIISVDTDQRVILFNAAAEQMFGCSAAEALGQPVDLFMPERFRQGHQHHIEVFGQRGVTNRAMGTLGVIFGQRLNGEEFPIEASISQVEAAGDKLFTVILRDVTERQRAQETLEESQKRLSMALAASHMGVWEWNLHTNAIFWSPECFPIIGVTGYDQSLTVFTDIVHPEDIDYVMTQANLAIANKTAYEAEFRVVHPSGDIRWVANIGQARYDENGEPLRLVGTVQDITDRKQTEADLRESEMRFRTYFEVGLVGMAITSPDKVILEVNDQICDILGYGRSELLQMTWEEITHPDDLALDVAQFDKVIRGESDRYSLEKRWVRKNGQIIHSAISVKGVRDENGVVNYLMKFVQDITKRKQAEEQLLYQANLLQNVSDAIIATDRHFTITGWNPAAEIIYGWSAEEAIGRGVAELLDTQYMDDETSGILQQFLDEGIWQGEVTQKHKNGATLNILSSVTFIKDKSDNLVGVVASNRNITAHKEAEMAHALLEAQLQQAQKMESIGQLASGVAHDFNNMLTVIQMYSELIRSKLPPDHPLIEKIELIRSASQRSSALTRQLLAFSRKQILAPKVIDLNDLITDLLKMVVRLIGEDIALSSVLQPELWPIMADPGQIEQVIMNLVVNARDAMPMGGMLTLETRNIQLDEAYARVHLETSPGPFVLLSVTDTGQGMDKQTQSRIFEPFFTTKEQGKGTGLGLATVHGIVKQSEGNILVYSELNSGTTFKIYLPANIDVSASPNDPQTQAVKVGGGETILMVEDEAMVRELVQDALRDLGYKVLVAHNGEAALSLVNHYSDPIDLLLTDVIMPRMSGRELAEQLRMLRPDINVLFMSGYTDDAVIRHGLLMAEVAFLHKPFSASELAGKVRLVLDKKVDPQ